MPSLGAVSKGLQDLKNRFVEGAKRRFEKVRYSFRTYRRVLRKKLGGRVKYATYELAPNILAYGLLLNVPGAFFFGFPITLFSVLAFGCAWYFVFEEVLEFLKEIFRLL